MCLLVCAALALRGGRSRFRQRSSARVPNGYISIARDRPASGWRRAPKTVDLRGGRDPPITAREPMPMPYKQGVACSSQAPPIAASPVALGISLGERLGLVVPALASAATLNVAPGGHDDAGNASGCSARPGGSFRCVTLRDAIAFANAGLAGANPTVRLAAGTYTLSNGALTSQVTLTVSGTGDSGAGASTIRQTGPDIVLKARNSLKLNGLVVTGANATGANATTGAPAGQPLAAITVSGSLALNRVAVVGNHAVGGAGLAQDNTNQFGKGAGVLGSAILVVGALSITNSIVSGNTAIGGAGGSSSGANPAGPGNLAVAAVFGFGSISVANSTISNNHRYPRRRAHADVRGRNARCDRGRDLHRHRCDRRSADQDVVRQQRGTGLATQHVHGENKRSGPLDHLHDRGHGRVRSRAGDEPRGPRGQARATRVALRVGCGREALPRLPNALDKGRGEDQASAAGQNNAQAHPQRPRNGRAHVRRQEVRSQTIRALSATRSPGRISRGAHRRGPSPSQITGHTR